MIKQLSVLAASVLLVASAHAAPINGSLSFSGFFGSLPAVPSATIVSAFPPVDVGSTNVGGGTGDFAGILAGVGFDFTNPPPDQVIYTAGGFTFTMQNLTPVSSSPLNCTAVVTGGFNCTDLVGFDLEGVVSGPGFDATLFEASWSANGACRSTDGLLCTSNVTASWSASVTAQGVEAPPPKIPEPASLALVGLALAGLAVTRRRKV